MKNILVTLSLAICIVSCWSSSKDEVQSFIPGTYVRFSEHEYGKVHDTLVFEMQNEIANQYKITQKWLYERVLDGKKMEPEYKVKETTGIYDSEKKLVTETPTGGIYSFDPSKNLLYAGKVNFKKIN